MPSTNGYYLTDVCDCGHDRADHVRAEHSRFICAHGGTCYCTDFSVSAPTDVVILTDSEHLAQLTNQLSQLQAQREYHLMALEELDRNIDVNIAARTRVLAATAITLDEM
jgi:hypothetical protein